MTTLATGPFDVKIAPLADAGRDAPFGSMSLEKHYHGDLEATAVGLMLSAGSPQKGSAGYVAMEKVVGTLHGKGGTFVLQHSATMHAGSSQLSITVAPGSGTGQLEGIAGTLAIKIAEGGKHSYEFEYTLPTAPGA